MNKKFFSNWAMLQGENSSLKVMTLGLTVALLVSSIANYNLYREKTVVVIPPKVTKEFQVSGNELSFSYFEQVGFYLSDRVLSVSAENAQNSFDTILPYLTTEPDAVKIIRENLSMQAQVIRENDIYQVFYPMRVAVNAQGMKFSVEGTLKKMSGNNHISTGKATITFDFIVKDGRLIIKSIEVK